MVNCYVTLFWYSHITEKKPQKENENEKKARYYMGKKYIVGICGKMGGQVFEREPCRVSGIADVVNAFGGRYPGTVEADE